MQDKKSYLVPIAIIIAGLVIAGAIYYRGGSPAGNGNIVTQGNQIPAKPIGPEDHIWGDAKAPVKFIVYTDLECPFCKTFHQTLTKAMADYGPSGKLAIVYRNFPLPIHPKSEKEHEAAECVAKLGGDQKYWAFVDKVFTITPANNGLDASLLPKLAGEVGVDVAKFSSCLNSGEMATKVQADITEGTGAGAEGTPYPIVVSASKGALGSLPGALPYLDETANGQKTPGIKSIIEQVLSLK